MLSAYVATISCHSLGVTARGAVRSHGSISRWKNGRRLASTPSRYSPRRPEWNLLSRIPGRPPALLSAAVPGAAAADGPPCVPGSVDGCGQNCTASEKVAPPPNERREAAPMICKCEKLRGPKSGPMSRVPSGRFTLGSRSLAPPSQRFHFSRSGAPG